MEEKQQHQARQRDKARRGREERDRKAGSQSSTYRHREETNARKQTRETAKKKREGCRTAQREIKGKNSDGLQDRARGWKKGRREGRTRAQIEKERVLYKKREKGKEKD
ncbi:hypothetical protein FK515_28225 [Klebsiella pneumoniae]|nr:hypothetical protein [Klebsiella pneumoniae]